MNAPKRTCGNGVVILTSVAAILILCTGTALAGYHPEHHERHAGVKAGYAQNNKAPFIHEANNRTVSSRHHRIKPAGKQANVKRRANKHAGHVIANGRQKDVRVFKVRHISSKKTHFAVRQHYRRHLACSESAFKHRRPKHTKAMQPLGLLAAMPSITIHIPW